MFDDKDQKTNIRNGNKKLLQCRNLYDICLQLFNVTGYRYIHGLSDFYDKLIKAKVNLLYH